MYIKRRNLIFSLAIVGLSLCSKEGFSSHIDYSSRGISEDYVASSIRPPQPLSVSRIIQELDKSEAIVESINLSDNNITIEGATRLLNRFQDYNRLKKVNLSFNRIFCDSQREDLQEKFENAVSNLLEKSNFKKLDLRTNEISNERWITYFAIKFGMKKAAKIKWFED